MGTRIALIGLLSANVALSAADPVTVRPAKPAELFRVGDNLRLEAEAEDVLTTMTDGRRVKEKCHTKKVQLEADLKVMAIDSKGWITRMELTVRKFSGRLDGKAVEPLKAGAVVTVRVAEAGPRLQRKDGRLTEAQRGVLAILLPLVRQPRPGFDSFLGTYTGPSKKPPPPWSTEIAAVAEWLRRNGIKVRPRDARGNATITGQRGPNGLPCVRIEADETIPKFSQPPSTRPGAGVLSYRVSTGLSGVFPADTSLPCLHLSLSIEMAVRVRKPKGKNGKGVTMLTVAGKTGKRSFVLLKRTSRPDRPKPAKPAPLRKPQQ